MGGKKRKTKKVFNSYEEYEHAYYPSKGSGPELTIDDPEGSGKRLAREAIRRFMSPRHLRQG